MTVWTAGTLTPNREGVNLYLGRDVIRQIQCPLVAGEEFVAHLVPGVGAIVLPAGATPSYPVTVDHPARIDPQLDLGELPLELPDQPPGPLATDNERRHDHDD